MKMMSNRTNDILIEKVRRDVHSPVQMAHFHPYYEIGYLVSGTRNMTINQNIYSMEKGDIVLVNKEALHKGSNAMREKEYIEWISLYFDEQYLEPFKAILGSDIMSKCFEDNAIIKVPAKRREYVEELLSKMILEYGKIDDMSQILIKAYFSELMSFLIRYTRNQDYEPSRINPDDEYIADAAQYLFANYSKNITLDDIAYKYSMSKSSFSKKFKKLIGCGFKEYLISIRIREACKRLSGSDDSITEIALSCGFSDSNYFGDAFKKIKGVSPNQYRKNKGMV